MKKFWTVQDGQVGTAHTSRDGRTTVDFRPMDRPAAVKDFQGRKVIEIRPPKGVSADPLILELTHTEWVVTKRDDPHPGVEDGYSIYRSNFCGVEFESTTGHGWRWYDEQKKLAHQAASQAEHQAWRDRKRREEDEQNRFVQSLEPAFFAGRIPLRDLSRLLAGSPQKLVARLKKEIYRAIGEDLGHEVLVHGRVGDLFSWSEGEKRLAEIRNLLLAEERRLREEKKQLWLAKAGRGGENV